MIITSVPAVELIHILKNVKRNEFKYYAFIVAREIDNRDILVDLFKNYSSFSSVTGNEILLVLFYNSNEYLSTILDVKEELNKQIPKALTPIYFHNCRLIRLELLESMAKYESFISGQSDTFPFYARDIINSFQGERINQDNYITNFDLEKYLRSMTEQTEAFKQAFNLSESDIPCLIIWDKEQDETSLLKFSEDTTIKFIYDIFREIVSRTIEREVLRRPIEEEISSKERILSYFDPTKPKHKKKGERLESRLSELHTSLKKIPQPELLRDVLSDIKKRKERKNVIKKISFQLPSLKEVFVKLLAIALKNFV